MLTRIQKFLMLFFLVISWQSSMHAQDFWQPTNGPYGGSVSGLGKDASGRIYCGTGNGVFRSSDNGDHWEFCSPTLPTQQILHFLLLPGDVILAVLNNGDLYRSTDLGNSWAMPLSLGSSNYITDMDYDSFSGAAYLVVYPLTGSPQCYRSFDKGATWQASATGITTTNVHSLAVNPLNGFVFINTFAGVFRTTNKGDTWQQMNSGITNQGMFGYAIAVDDQGTVFAGFSSGSMGGTPVPGAIYVSTNQGASWTASNNGIANPDVHLLACSPHGELYAVNGQENGLLYRSTNRGATWSLTSVGWITSDWAGMYFDGVNAFIGTSVGVERSTDAGVNWNRTNEGLLNAYVSDLASNGNQSMYASTLSSGMYRTTNAGGKWTQELAGLAQPDIESVVRTRTGALIAARNAGSTFTSMDDGVTWVSSDSGKPTFTMNNHTLAVNDSDHVFLGFLSMINMKGILRALNMIYRSMDDGKTWRICHDTLANVWAQSIQFADEKTILAGGLAGLWRSLDDGWSWNKLANQKGADQIATLHFDRTTQRLYSATYNGLYFSTDRGETFHPLDTTTISQTWAITASCDILLAAAGANDIRLSSNAGKTWTQIKSGLNGKRILKFLWMPDGWLYAATSGGVYRCTQKIVVPPSAPQLAAPHDTASNMEMSMVLQWLAACNAASYRIQVATDAAFTNIVVDSAGFGTTTFTLANLKSMTQYFWRVQAFGNNLYGNWSDVRSFTTKLLPPPAPALSYPSNNAMSVSTDVNMLWEFINSAEFYRLQVATDSGFSALVFNQGSLTTNAQAVTGLAKSTVHYWRVNASNSAGEGAWSSVWKFTTVAAIPTVPILLAPLNDASGVAPSPTLTWNAVSGAASYRVQISTDANFSSMILDQAGITNTSFTAPSLATNTKYFWRVNASNTAGTSPWSEVWSFTTALNPPAAPTLISPIDNATEIARDTTLVWNAIASATSYRLQVSMNQSFLPLFIDSAVMTTTHNVSGLAASTKYYWRVNATNTSGTSVWSSAWSFTTIIAKPLAPTLLSPPDNAANIPLNPTLTWNPAAGADAYRVQVSLNALFTPVLKDTSLTATTYSLIGLANNVIHFWRVNAKNIGGTSDWSSVWRFQTMLVSVNDEIGEESFRLEQNYPNPFAQSTSIGYRLLASGHVRLEVFDLLGRKLATLVDEVRDVGEHRVKFEADGVSPGIYVYRLQTKNIILYKKLVITR